MLRSASGKSKRARTSDQTGAEKEAAAPTAAAGSGPENQPGQHVPDDIRWHFCDPNAKGKPKKPGAAAPAAAAAAAADGADGAPGRKQQRNQKQVNALLSLMQRGQGQVKRQKGDNKKAAATAPAHRLPTALSCWEPRSGKTTAVTTTHTSDGASDPASSSNSHASASVDADGDSAFDSLIDNLMAADGTSKAPPPAAKATGAHLAAATVEAPQPAHASSELPAHADQVAAPPPAGAATAAAPIGVDTTAPPPTTPPVPDAAHLLYVTDAVGAEDGAAPGAAPISMPAHVQQAPPAPQPGAPTPEPPVAMPPPVPMPAAPAARPEPLPAPPMAAPATTSVAPLGRDAPSAPQLPTAPAPAPAALVELPAPCRACSPPPPPYTPHVLSGVVVDTGMLKTEQGIEHARWLHLLPDRPAAPPPSDLANPAGAAADGGLSSSSSSSSSRLAGLDSRLLRGWDEAELIYVELRDEWRDTPVRPADRCNLVGPLLPCGCAASGRSVAPHERCTVVERARGPLLVMRPEALVTGTALAQFACDCPRRAALSRGRGDP